MFNTVPNTEGNPIFSSYSTRTQGFNENMDEYVKAPNDLYIEEQKKKNQQLTGNPNKNALGDIPDMPKFLEEEYADIGKLPKWLEDLHVATPQEIEEWKQKGGMGIAEAWEKNHKWASFAPYVNTTRDAADAITASVLLNRAKNGEELSMDQKEKLVDYLRDMKELEVRGFTFGGGTVNAILTSIPYLEEFGIGLAASGEGVGLASLGKTLSGIGGKRAARKAVEVALKEAAIKSAAPAAVKTTLPLSAAKKIYKDTLAKTTTTQALKNVAAKEALKETGKALPHVVGSSAKFGLTKMPHTFAGGIADKQISSGIYISDAGEAVFSNSENLALSVMKSLGETTFEALTETAGWAFSPVASYFAKPVRNVLPKKFFTEFEKLVTSRYGMPAAEALKKYGYDGVVEEMGEEVLNRFLCQVFGLNGLEQYNFDGFMNNVLYANDPSQWGQEALSFAAVGAGGHVVAGTGSKVADEWKKKKFNKNIQELTDKANRYNSNPMEKYADEMRLAQQKRLEEFYLEQGLVKIKGSQSRAEQRLREIWTSQNVDASLQDDVLKNMSELEIREELKRNLENTSDLTPEEASEKIVKDLTEKFVDNKIFANEKNAKSVATLFAAPLQKLSEVTGQSLEELMQEEMPEIKREAEQAAAENGINIAIQKAMDKRMNDLNELPDDFDDEAYIQEILDDIEILEKMDNGTLTQEEFAQANNVIERLGLSELQQYQQIDDVGIRNIEENFGDTVENITGNISDDVRNILENYDVNEDEFKFEDIRIYGSYSTGRNNENSDIDVLVQYSGSMREDDAFNMFHDEGLVLVDKNGREVEIDINPINVDQSGTIDEKLEQMGDYQKRYFQSAETAGVENSADNSAAKKEWEEKGVESKYFKKWFGDSKVVDKDGKPLVVYHGTLSNFNVFDREKGGQSNSIAKIGYWFSPEESFARGFANDIWYGEQKEPIVMQVYLSMKNPKVYKKRNVTEEEENIARAKVEELEKKVRDINSEYNRIVRETGSFAKANEHKEKSKHLFDELKQARNELAELRYSDPYQQLKTDIHKMDGGNAETANTGGLGMGLKNKDTLEKFVSKLKSEGYDGIIVQGTEYDKEFAEDATNNQYVAFDAEQIKSVNNQGTFDANNPNIYYQEETPDNNLIMTHATSSENIDAILEDGVLVAPSFAITKKGQKELTAKNFGDVLFIRNPEVIDYKKDNIFNRDIYSPRIPRPDYKTKYGQHVSAYEYGSMERQNARDPKDFERVYGSSFEEYFDGAKKVIFEGFTPAGKRKLVDYTPKNLLKHIKKQSLLGGEGNYGLSSFLARLSEKQTSKKKLKQSAAKGLQDRINADKEYQALRDEYADLLFGDITKYYKFAGDSWQKISDDDFEYIMVAIATNNKKQLAEVVDVDNLPEELYNKLKDFTNRALNLPRSYFEAKPMREVDLSEFPFAVAEVGILSDVQKKRLLNKGVKVVEYANGNMEQALKEIEKATPEIYFQFIGEKGAKTSDRLTGSNILDKLEEAKKLEEKGTFPDTIRKETGWFKGADKKWRFEISDKDAEIINTDKLRYHEYDPKLSRDSYYDQLNEINKHMGQLVQDKNDGKISQEEFDHQYELAMFDRNFLIDSYERNTDAYNANRHYLTEILKHDALFAVYPDLKYMFIEVVPEGQNYGGRYVRSAIQIPITTIKFGDLKSVLMHEIQHYIQDREDFNWGGNIQSVEGQLREALEEIESTDTFKKKVEIEKILNDEYEDHYVLSCALQTSRVAEKEDALFKTWWWSEKGSWWIPRKTRKKEYRTFMNEWVQKYFDAMNADMKERGKLNEYHEYCRMNINELRRLYRNSQARRDRLWKKKPRDIAYHIRAALKELDETTGEYSRETLKRELYKRLAGETEARNTQARMDMTDEERKKTSPKTTQDYGDADQFVVFSDGTTLSYFAQTPEEEPVQTNMLYDNITPRKLRNLNIKGAYVPAENLIELFKNADESTIIHEFAHWWLTRLEKYSQYNEELALDLAEVRKFVKNDGGKFTQEQHEKFARGFEAYIRNGSARNNRLKRIFEDFKNALIQIYDSLKQIVYTNDGTDFSFSEEDVKNLENLFERLLTTENERIKKTVFDRCDDINERIKQIKEHQEQEMRELDELWKDNIAINNRKSDKKRKVDEYVELAEKAVNKVPKEVREMKERYKKATLGILSQATGYKPQYIANPRNWERVQMALEHADDKITTSGGMRAEWTEFYNDTGVNYDNDEIDGDYKLAEQAFNVLTDGTYNFNNMNEDDIGEFYGKFEYLYGKILTLKGEEKEAAYEALMSLFNNMPSMPDEVVVDLVERLGKVEVDYNEGQKDDFNRKHYPNIPVVQQLQFYVTNKLNELKIYDPNVRYKVRISKSHNLYKTIKHATSVNSTKKIIRKINEYVISDLENQAKTILHKEIQKQIKTNSKLVKVGTIKKGKFDWKTNTVFGELAELNKLGQKDAFKEYALTVSLDNVAAGEEREDADENVNSTPEMATDFQSKLKRKFLEYRSHRIKDLDLAMTRSLLEDIMTLKFEGRRAKDEQELEKRLQQDNMKTDLVQRVREIKGNTLAKEVAKFIMGENPLTTERTLANWETSLNALFGREVAQRYSLLKLESDAEVYAYKHYSEFCRKAMEIYGLNNPVDAKAKVVDAFNRFVDYGNIQPLVKLMQDFEEEVYEYKEVTFSKETGQFVETGVQLSKAEIITLYTWSLNEELEQRLMTQYGVEQIRHMFETVLNDEDKQFAWLLIDTCDGIYDENNEVFIRTLGLSLPKVENYFPSKTVRVGSEIDMLHEHVVRSSNPSFIKERKKCNRIKMKPDNPISILLPHINKTARYVILSERLNYLNTIFKDATVRAAMKEVFDGVELPTAENRIAGKKIKGKKNKQRRTVGDRIHDTLLNQLGSSTFENYVRGLNVGKTWADTLATNYITSRIGGNLKVAFGQLTSVINYAERMPAGEWGVEFVKGLKTPKETFKFMMDNCDYLKARLSGNSMNEIMQRITDEADRFRTLRNFCSTNTKYGDILAICFGGKPYVDYLMKQGKTKEEAFEKFVEDTLRAQQSGHNSATSVWQKKMSENFFTRMMFAFNNTSLQYERKFLDAVASKARGEIDTKTFVKAVLIYKVFNPIIFTSFLGNLSFLQLISSLMNGDGDDDALARFGIDATSAMVFANMGAYGFAGMAFTTVGRFLMAMIDKKEYKPFLSSVPIISDIEDIGKDLILKNEITVADWVDAMAMIGDDATGVPVSRVSNALGGFGDIADGQTGAGLLRMIGYGRYKAYQATTGKPPEKK